MEKNNIKAKTNSFYWPYSFTLAILKQNQEILDPNLLINSFIPNSATIDVALICDGIMETSGKLSLIYY